jgi:tetratricopeptide (TPR) repeat protein
MRVASLLVPLLLVAPTAAHAQDVVSTEPPTGVEAARVRYALGAAFFRAGRFEESIEEFGAAYALWRHPTVLYSLGQAHERLLHVGEAMRYYARYLAESPPDAPHRAEVADTMRGLHMLLAEVEVVSNVPARVFVHNEDVGAAPGTLQLAAGRYPLELRADGYTSERQLVTLAGHTRRSVVFRLTRRPAPTPPAGLHPGWFWTSVGLAGASAIAAATLGGLTLRASSAFDAAQDRTLAMREDGQRLALGTDLALGATALFGVAAIVLGVHTAWHPAPRVSVALAPGGLTGSF